MKLKASLAAAVSLSFSLSTLVDALPLIEGAAHPVAAKRAPSENELVGFATLNGGTTGGGDSVRVTVSTLAALKAAVAGDAPKTIIVDGVIQGDLRVIDIGSNTSLLGKSGGSVNGLTRAGFRVRNGRNVIIRNLQISLTSPIDLLNIQNSTNVWIDHSEFFNALDRGIDHYDGACDITHGSSYITVSWNLFHDSFKTSLIGHDDSNGAVDTGKLKVTYHSNHFRNVGSRIPSIRFGTAHVFGNFYEDIFTSGVNSRMGAQVLVEGNVFKNVSQPILTSNFSGFAVQRDNLFLSGSGAPDTSRLGNLTVAPYAYLMPEVQSVEARVSAGAGVGSKIVF